MKKKLIALSLCAITSTSILPSVTTFAATNSKEVIVSYDTTNTIPDPDNPGNPEYQVLIPSSIVFEGINKPVDVSVSIKQGNDKNQDYTGDANVNVKVKSDNEFKVTNSSEDLKYTLGYGNTILTGSSENLIGTLSSSNLNIAGKATLIDQGHKLGYYVDKLTYSIEKTSI